MPEVVFKGGYYRREIVAERLDELFPEGNYSLTVRQGEWAWNLPRQLTKSESQAIRDQISALSVHYQTQDENEVLRGNNHLVNVVGNATVQPDSRHVETDTSTFLQTIPQIKSVPGKPLSFAVAPFSSWLASVTFHSQGDDKVFQGLYGEEIEMGETSKVFKLYGELKVSSVSFDEGKPVLGMEKFAVKRLRRATTLKEFQIEFETLKTVQSLSHPHIVEILTAFRREEEGVQVFGFLFPLALGNLKRLFRGDYDSIKIVSAKTPSLWSQFIGLASAVAYLHETCNIAHRDIKPSNVLVFIEEGTEDMILKLTDFGLSVDLSNSMTWQAGSAAAMSALVYDAPEYRSAFLARHKGKVSWVPSPQQVLSNDIWKLGSVFTELAFFITGGSQGVQKFRDSIMKGTRIDGAEFISDSFDYQQTGEPHFDNGERVKPEVLAAINELSIQQEEVAAIEQILFNMLAEASLRPSARLVCEFLVSGVIRTGLLHNDGTRLVKLYPGSPNPRVSLFDRLRLFVERRTRHPVDWYPFPPLIRPCFEGEMRVSWQYGEKQLCINLSSDETQRYKTYCLPAFSNGSTVLPSFHSSNARQPTVPPSSHQPTKPTRVSGAGPPKASASQAAGPPSSSGTARPPSQASSTSQEVYWCIDRFFSEPKEIMRRPVSLRHARTDEDFFHQTNQALDKTRENMMDGWLDWLGWLLNQLSWKSCVGVDFKEFYIIKTGQDQVYLGDVGLPPSVPASNQVLEYEHGIKPPDAIQMKLVAAQIVAGLRDPRAGRGQTEMIFMLPKKRVPPDFKKTMRTMGWGMHAKMGYSAKKMLWWLVFCFLVLVTCAVPWLVWVNRFDLQNAFVPGGTIVAVFTACVAIAQVVG